MTAHWKADEQYFKAVLFCPVCNFGKSINLHGAGRGERVNIQPRAFLAQAQKPREKKKRLISRNTAFRLGQYEVFTR